MTAKNLIYPIKKTRRRENRPFWS